MKKKLLTLLLLFLSILIIGNCGPKGDSDEEKVDDTKVEKKEGGEEGTTDEADEADVDGEVDEKFAGLDVIEEGKPDDSSGSKVAFNFSLGGALKAITGNLVSGTTSSNNNNTSTASASASASDNSNATADDDVVVDDGIYLESGVVITSAQVSVCGIGVHVKREVSKKEKELSKKIMEMIKESEKEEEEILEEEDAAEEELLEEDEEEVDEEEAELIASVDKQATVKKDKMAEAKAKAEKGKSAKGEKGQAGKGKAGMAKDKIADAKGKMEKKVKELKAKSKKQLEKQKDLNKNVRYQGPYVVDLMTHEITPAIKPVELNDGTYKRLGFRLCKHRGKETDPLNGHVAYITGYFTDDAGEKVTFVVILEGSQVIRIVSPKGFKLSSGEDKFALVFDVKKWFKGVDFTKFKTVAMERFFDRVNYKLSKIGEKHSDYDKLKKDMDKRLGKIDGAKFEGLQTKMEERKEKMMAQKEKAMSKIADAKAKKMMMEAKKQDRIRERLNVAEDIDLIVHPRLSSDPVVRKALKRIRFNIKKRFRMGKKKASGEIDTTGIDVDAELDEDSVEEGEEDMDKEVEDEVDEDDVE